MERRLVFLLCFVFLVGFVFAAEEWGAINEGNISKGSLDDSESEIVGGDSVEYSSSEEYVGGDGTFFTAEFYIALILALIILAVVGVVVWFFLRGPRNEWEKQSS